MELHSAGRGIADRNEHGLFASRRAGEQKTLHWSWVTQKRT